MKPIIIANWKCNPLTAKEIKHWFSFVLKEKPSADLLVVCPPFVFLPLARELAGKKIHLGAQNVFYANQGAYTGEVSGLMLKQVGCQFVIIGHSERRRLFKESDEVVNKKVKAALKARLKPILCVGEKEKIEGDAFGENLKQQLQNGLLGVSAGQLENIIIAYEPVWAIGTGDTPSQDEVFCVFLLLQKILADIYDKRILAQKVRIIYGGSVNAKNAASFIKEGKMQGLLIGGASLRASEFVSIIKSVQE